VGRGKGEESVRRVDYTRRVIEGLVPELLDKPVSTIDPDLRTLRAAAEAGSGSPVWRDYPRYLVSSDAAAQ